MVRGFPPIFLFPTRWARSLVIEETSRFISSEITFLILVSDRSQDLMPLEVSEIPSKQRLFRRERFSKSSVFSRSFSISSCISFIFLLQLTSSKSLTCPWVYSIRCFRSLTSFTILSIPSFTKSTKDRKKHWIVDSCTFSKSLKTDKDIFCPSISSEALFSTEAEPRFLEFWSYANPGESHHALIIYFFIASWTSNEFYTEVEELLLLENSAGKKDGKQTLNIDKW